MRQERSRRWVGVLGLLACVLVGFLIHVRTGASTNYSWGEFFRGLTGGPGGDADSTWTIWVLRVPRASACILVGALLAGAGSAFQALFKNRLAEPYTVGTASGAAIGGVVAQAYFPAAIAAVAMPLAGFATGIGSLALVMLVARRRGKIETPTLLLAGVLVGVLLNATMSLILYLDNRDTNRLLGWLLGNVDSTPPSSDWMMLAVLAVAGGALITRSRELNALAFGEETARRLGVNVGRLKALVLLAGGAMTAAAVGAAGVVAFVGLVAPHLTRRLIGVDWRFSLPASMAMGSVIVLVADGIGQRISVGAIPLGVMTALISAPVLITLLGSRRS
ncbi:MAG TPA: iron ABC transporter permease [Fimbriimonadaceae bacterium]|nr:iron ABC transporter permease [Fimbriimonadaceae bacterium]